MKQNTRQVVRPGPDPDALRADLERRRSSAASPQLRGNRRARTRRAARERAMGEWR